MKRTTVLLAFTLLVFSIALPAAEPTPSFVVATVEGEAVRGPLRELKADWSLRLGDKTLTAKDIVTLRRANAKLPPFPIEKHILFANGDRVPMSNPRVEGEKLFFRNDVLGDGQEISAPLAAVGVLWLAAPETIEYPDRMRRQLLSAARSRDRILLRNGDVLEGLFNALDAKHVQIEVDRKTLTVAPDKVSAIALSTDSQDRLRPKGVYARIVLTGDSTNNGMRLSLSEATCDGTTLRGKTLFGATLQVPLARLASLELLQGSAVYLSELKPTKFEQTSYLGDSVKWPLAIDAAVTGRDLRLQGSVYDTGLGMHTRSRVTFALDGKYRRFEVVVGLDDETGRAGAARIRVFADGKAVDLGKDGEVTGQSSPLVVRVPVEGVKELTLEADFGPRGDVQGHVDWADARLIK